MYLVMALDSGGQSLEKFKVWSFYRCALSYTAFQIKTEAEGVSILLQVMLNLIVAEEKLKFEHRDLHVGNVLVERKPDDVDPLV